MPIIWKKRDHFNGYADQIFHLLQRNLTQAVDNFVDGRFPDLKKQLMVWRPRVDLKETDKEYILTADIPGVEKKDLNIEFNQGILTIKGERKTEEHKNEEKSHYTERFHGKFMRSFGVDEDAIDQEKINAKFENGVLTVTLKKKPGAHTNNKGSGKTIEIK
jgi:HSP20 family protein